MKILRQRKKVIIPMNAMSDVAFLLLIFIMLVSLINYRREVKIEYPEAETTKKTSAAKNLEIWIDSEGLTYIDGIPGSLQDIENVLTGIYQTAPDTRVHIIADKYTPFRNIHEVLYILQLLQHRVVSFVVKDA